MLQQFLMESQKFISMQKKLRQYRKTHFIITRQNGENVDPIGDCIPFDEETCAKDMLFQLAEHDQPIDLTTPRVNDWFKCEPPGLKNKCFSSTKPTKAMRKTVHMRPFAEIKVANQAQCEQNAEDSIIPSLKMQLRKLESPQKRKEMQEKKRKLQYLQDKLRRKSDLVLVEELLQHKKNSIRIKKAQSQKKTNPLPKEQPIHKPLLFSYNPKPKSSSQQVLLLKQARRNRTLRNILF